MEIPLKERLELCNYFVIRHVIFSNVHNLWALENLKERLSTFWTLKDLWWLISGEKDIVTSLDFWKIIERYWVEDHWISHLRFFEFNNGSLDSILWSLKQRTHRFGSFLLTSIGVMGIKPFCSVLLKRMDCPLGLIKIPLMMTLGTCNTINWYWCFKALPRKSYIGL